MGYPGKVGQGGTLVLGFALKGSVGEAAGNSRGHRLKCLCRQMSEVNLI